MANKKLRSPYHNSFMSGAFGIKGGVIGQITGIPNNLVITGYGLGGITPPAPTQTLTVGAGYDTTTLNMLNADRGLDTPRIEYGWHGQVGSSITSITTQSRVSPVLQWVTPFVTDTSISNDIEIQVQSWAAAADGILGGTESVEFWASGGQPVKVTSMSAMSVPVYGRTRLIPGYKVKLPVTGITEGSYTDIYARANPTSAMIALGMVPRVIGPMRIYRKTLPDGVVNLYKTGTTNPAATSLNPPSYSNGANYDSLKLALNAIANWTGWLDSHIEIRCAEDQTIDVGGTYSGTATTNAFTDNTTKTNTRRGRVKVDGNGFNVVMNSNRWMSFGTTGLDNRVRFFYNGLTLTNIKVDSTRMGVFMPSANEKIFSLLDNVEIYGAGITEAPGADGTEMKDRPSSLFSGISSYVMARCFIRDMAAHDFTMPFRLGTKIRNSCGDAISLGTRASDNLRMPYSMIAEDMDYVSSIPLSAPTQVITLNYTGPEGVSKATYTIRGAVANYTTNPRTLALRVNNQDVTTFTFAAPQATSGIQSISDLATAINAWSTANANGYWTATLVGAASSYNHLRAGYLCTQRYGAAYASGNGSAQPDSILIADIPITAGLWTGIAQHPDLIQFIGQDNYDNVIFSCSYATRFNTQGLTAQVTQATTWKMSNIAFVLNAHHCDTNADDFKALNSYVGGILSHFLCVHNTEPTMAGFLFNTTAAGFNYDQFCRYDANYNETSYVKTSNDGTVVTPIDTSQFPGQMRRNRSLHNYSFSKNTWDITTLYGDLQSDNRILDTSVTTRVVSNVKNTMNIADYPAIIHGLTIDGIQATFTINDFIPASNGYLRQNLVLAQTPYDIEGRPFSQYDLAGPIAASASST